MWIENLSEEIEHMSGSQHAACSSSKPGTDLKDRSKHKTLQRGIRLLVHASINFACSVKLAASKTMAWLGQRKLLSKGWRSSHALSPSTIVLISAANRVLATC